MWEILKQLGGILGGPTGGGILGGSPPMSTPPFNPAGGAGAPAPSAVPPAATGGFMGRLNSALAPFGGTLPLGVALLAGSGGGGSFGSNLGRALSQSAMYNNQQQDRERDRRRDELLMRRYESEEKRYQAEEKDRTATQRHRNKLNSILSDPGAYEDGALERTLGKAYGRDPLATQIINRQISAQTQAGDGSYTLSPGSARYDASGKVIAERPFSPNFKFDGSDALGQVVFDPRTGRLVQVTTPTQEADAQANVAATKEEALARVARQGREREMGLTYQLYETARDGLISGLEGAQTDPITGRLPPMTAAQQTAEGGVAAMAPVLKQLFRVAGEGTFTDRDQALLLEMVPKRTDLPEARQKKIRNIDNIVRAKLGIPANGGGAHPPAGGNAGQSDPLGIR